MKKFISILLIIVLITSITVFAVACKKNKVDVDPADLDPTIFDFSNVLKDFNEAPSQKVADSVQYDIASILDSDEYTDAYKSAAAVLFGTANETFSMQYAYFREQIGQTKLKDNSGYLIYQRLRRESNEIPTKDDTTLKLPVNHNFGNTEVSFVSNAAIRYVNGDHLYHRFENDSNMKYNKTTKLIEVDKWKKQSNSNWHREDNLGYGYGEFTGFDQKKIQLDVGVIGEDIESSEVKDSLIKADSVKISKENGVYTISFEADLDKANKDKNTINALQNDNSGKNMKYTALKVTIEIWECGLIKSYDIDEGWSGKIGAAVIWYNGNATARSIIKYSYSDADCLNYEKAEQLTKSLCDKC